MARNVSDGTKQGIGETLKRLRQEKLWSQAELAHRIGTTPVSVGRWENNVTHPNLHFQQQLCEVFVRSPEDLGFVPQAESESREDVEYSDQLQQMEPRQPASTIFAGRVSDRLPFLEPVPSAPLTHGPIPQRGGRRRRRLLLVALACLSLFLLLGALFWSVKQFAPSASAHPPSCQAPSPHESTAAIYTQVMCRHALISSVLNRQDGLRWDENDQCRFQQGAYHVLLPTTEYVAKCFAHATSLGPNFALQVDVTFLKGNSGGLVFRAEGPSSNWDVITSLISIDVWGQYNFNLASTTVPCHLTKDPIAPAYCYAPHGTITYGANVTNTMMVVALGSQIYLYVNGFFIDQARAPASSSLTGFFGVFANGSHATADAAFRHFQAWKL